MKTKMYLSEIRDQFLGYLFKGQINQKSNLAYLISYLNHGQKRIVVQNLAESENFDLAWTRKVFKVLEAFGYVRETWGNLKSYKVVKQILPV